LTVDRLACATQTLAHWAAHAQATQVTADVQAATRRAWHNWFGCALGGASDPALDQLMGALRPLGGAGNAPLIGRAEQTDPATSALLHAFASNILDYDDTHWATAIHPAGPVASALVGLSSQTSVSGEAFLHAFLVGMEVACRIGLAVSPGHYARGWHITATCGVFGAAAAVGRLMGLSSAQMAAALGHAATQSAGLVASLGTGAKSLNIAYAARNGLVAAQLARHAITANNQVLEARFGFAEVMGPGALPDTLCEGLGEHWEAARNAFKPYPCGFLVHPALDACLTAPDPLVLVVDTIEQVIVSVHPLAKVRADRSAPADSLAAKLSVQHAVAVALLYGDAGVQRFTEVAVHDAAVAALRQRVRLVADDGLGADSACIGVRLRDGREITRAVRPVDGQPPSAMSDAALTRKFRELVAYGAPHCDVESLLSALEHFPRTSDVSALWALTRPPI